MSENLDLLPDKLEESTFQNNTSLKAIIEAKGKGHICVFPGTQDIQLDIDDEPGYKVYLAHKKVLEKNWGILQEVIRPSKSGKPGKKHITLTLKMALSPLERITLQACMGSDRMRELLSLVQLNAKDQNPTLFFERKP
jgi:hypothetical protein